MGITITLSKVKLVKESTHRYGEIASRNISDPKDAVDIINAVFNLEEEAQEVMIVMYLDAKNKVTGIMEIGRGSANATIASPRETFKGAILHNAVSIIMAHNHPSGDTMPSREDLMITRQMKKAGEIIGIPLIDHIIIGYGEYTSIKECGEL